MYNSGSISSPMVPDTKLSKEGNGGNMDSTNFMQLVGFLMYLIATRLEMMFVVSLINR